MTDSTHSEPRVLTGRCSCAAVRFEVPDLFAYSLNCHCSDCRRVTGAAFKSFAGIARDQFRIVHGADRLWRIGEPDACDLRCRDCGSFLGSVVRGGAFVHVALGTLDDAPMIRPTAHIFVGSMAPWYVITDDLPQFDQHVTSM